MKLKLIKASEVEIKSVEWLWYPYIPYGKVTVAGRFRRREKYLCAEPRRHAQPGRADALHRRQRSGAGQYHLPVLRGRRRRYEMMSRKYQQEQTELDDRLKEISATLESCKRKNQGVTDFLSLIRSYAGITELTAATVNTLIDKITVSERQKAEDGTVTQEIKIYYKFVGYVDELHIAPTKRWTAFPEKECAACGKVFLPGSAVAKYCPACSPKIQRKQSNESKRRSRAKQREQVA